MTRAEDARCAGELGAAFLGFIFAESPRRADPNALSAWLPDVRAEFPELRTVGVFVDPDTREVNDHVEALGLDFVQVIRAAKGFAFDSSRLIEVRTSRELEAVGAESGGLEGLSSVTGERPFAWLVDTPSKQGGGSGRSFDWSILESFRVDWDFTEQEPAGRSAEESSARLAKGTAERPAGRPAEGSAARSRLFLAGGLGPDNVAEAIRRVRPYAVDASSRLESEPGKKDPQLLLKYFEAIREVTSPQPVGPLPGKKEI